MSEGCQYIGPDQDPLRDYPVMMCGCKQLWPGRPYCEEHVWKVYQKGTAQGMARKNAQIEKDLAVEREIAELARQQEIEEMEIYND
jgi:hypothetical protein